MCTNFRSAYFKTFQNNVPYLMSRYYSLAYTEVKIRQSIIPFSGINLLPRFSTRRFKIQTASGKPSQNNAFSPCFDAFWDRCLIYLGSISLPITVGMIPCYHRSQQSNNDHTLVPWYHIPWHCGTIMPMTAAMRSWHYWDTQPSNEHWLTVDMIPCTMEPTVQ